MDGSFKALMERNRVFDLEDNFITLSLFVYLPFKEIEVDYVKRKI